MHDERPRTHARGSITSARRWLTGKFTNGPSIGSPVPNGAKPRAAASEAASAPRVARADDQVAHVRVREAPVYVLLAVHRGIERRAREHEPGDEDGTTDGGAVSEGVGSTGPSHDSRRNASRRRAFAMTTRVLPSCAMTATPMFAAPLAVATTSATITPRDT